MVSHAIVHEVNRPTFVRPRHGWNCISTDEVDLTLATGPHLQAKIAIDTSEAMLADRDALTSNHYDQTTPAPTRSFLCELLQRGSDRGVVFCLRAIIQRSSRLPGEVTSAHAREAPFFHRPHRFFPLRGPHPFFSISSLTTSISRVCRAIILRICAFSASSCLSRARSLVSMPAYLSRQSRIVLA